MASKRWQRWKPWNRLRLNRSPSVRALGHLRSCATRRMNHPPSVAVSARARTAGSMRHVPPWYRWSPCRRILSRWLRPSRSQRPGQSGKNVTPELQHPPTSSVQSLRGGPASTFDPQSERHMSPTDMAHRLVDNAGRKVSTSSPHDVVSVLSNIADQRRTALTWHDHATLATAISFTQTPGTVFDLVVVADACSYSRSWQ
jgi:hypothetical protein